MNLDLVTIALLTGMIGDLILQILSKFFSNGLGLKTYFATHGILESMFIAGGLLAFVYVLYQYIIDKYKITTTITLVDLMIMAIILDLLFRYLKLFPSLKYYYRTYSIPITMTFGSIIPILIPYVLYTYVLPKIKI